MRYIAASCPSHIRDMGFLAETNAMRRRSRENRASWQPHLDRSRRFILASAERCIDRGIVVVLGSGLLLDVPLAELSSMFRRVVLADIVILPEVQRAVRKHGNVTLVQHDVTGAAFALYEAMRCRAKELPLPEPSLPENTDSPSLVVSLNILSQLWVVPRAYLLKRLPGIDPDVVDDWCRGLVASHLEMLKALPARVCLIADHAFVKKDRSGAVVRRDSTVYHVPIGTPDESWTWDIVPMHETSGRLANTLIVGGWHDF